MVRIAASLWRQDDAVILSAELILIASVVIVGMVVGLGSVRDSITTELADLAQAIANLDQSFTMGGIVGHHSYTRGVWFFDRADFCDNNRFSVAHPSKCVSICHGAVPFGTRCSASGEQSKCVNICSDVLMPSAPAGALNAG